MRQLKLLSHDDANRKRKQYPGVIRNRNTSDLYFEPKYEEFRSRTMWSLSYALMSAFKELDPIPQFRATAKRGEFLEARFS
jgi:hypothetical protein